MSFYSRNKTSYKRPVMNTNPIVAVAAAPVGAIDTFGMSLLGWDDSTVSNTLDKIGLGDAYYSNRSATRAIGDVGSLFIGGAAIPKALSYTGRGAKILSKSSAFAKEGSKTQKALRMLSYYGDGQETNNRFRKIMAHQINKTAKIGGNIDNLKTSSFGRLTDLPILEKKVRSVQWGKTALDNIGMELYYHGFLRESDLIGYDEFNAFDQIMLPLAFGGLEKTARLISHKSSVRKIFNKGKVIEADAVVNNFKEMGVNLLNTADYNSLNVVRGSREYAEMLIKRAEELGSTSQGNALRKTAEQYSMLANEVRTKQLVNLGFNPKDMDEDTLKLANNTLDLLSNETVPVSAVNKPTFRPDDLQKKENVHSLITSNGSKLDLQPTIHRHKSFGVAYDNETNGLTFVVDNKKVKDISFKDTFKGTTLEQIEMRKEGIKHLADKILDDKTGIYKTVKGLNRRAVLEVAEEVFNRIDDLENPDKALEKLHGFLFKQEVLTEGTINFNNPSVVMGMKNNLKSEILKERLYDVYDYIKHNVDNYKGDPYNDIFEIIDNNMLQEFSGLRLADLDNYVDIEELVLNSLIRENGKENIDDFVEMIVENGDINKFYDELNLNHIKDEYAPMVVSQPKDTDAFRASMMEFNPVNHLIHAMIEQLDMKDYGQGVILLKQLKNLAADIDTQRDFLNPLALSQYTLDRNIASSFMFQASKWKDNPQLNALYTYANTYYHRAKQLTKRQLTPLKQEMVKIQKSVSRDKLNIIKYDLGRLSQVVHYGWDVTEHLTLEMTPNNIKRFAEAFNGQQLKEGTVIPDQFKLMKGEYVPLKTSEEARRLAMMISDEYGKVFESNNVLGQILEGTKALKSKPFYMPYFDVVDKEMAILVNQAGEMQGYVIGDTLASAKKLADGVVGDLNKAKGGIHSVVTSDDLGRYHAYTGAGFNDALLDYTDGFKPVKKQGGYIAKEINVNKFNLDGYLNDLDKRHSLLHARTMGALNRDVLKVNEMGKVMSSSVNTSKDFNINDMFEAILLNQKPVKKSQNPLLTLSEWSEQQWVNLRNSYLDNVAPKINELFSAIPSTGFAERKIAKLYDELLKTDPNSRTLDEFIETYSKTSIPRTLRQGLVAFNAWTTQAMLNTVSMGHSLLTVSSHFTTVPTAVMSFARRTGESLEDYKLRVEPFGLIIDDAGSSAVPSMNKIMLRGIERTFKNKEWLKEAEEYGATSIPWVEFLDELDKGILGTKVFKGLRFMTEKAENLARLTAYATGYELAEAMGKSSSKSMKHAFAMQFSNRAIADYAQVNKPTAYSGTLGIPFGLFKSFTTNYYTRMYNAIQDGDLRTLLVNQSTQALLFGTEGTMGYGLLNKLFSDDENNESFTTKFLDQADPVFGEAILSGTIWNLPRLLNLGEGVSLLSRADVNPRANLVNFNPKNTPAYSIVENFLGMGKEMHKSIQEQGFSPLRATEITSAYFPVREVRGLMEIAMGHSVNRQGNTVTQDTRTWENILVRLMGLKTVGEARMAQLAYEATSYERKLQGETQALAKNYEALIKSGKTDSDAVEKIISEYLKKGGSPQYVATWILNRYKKAGSMHNLDTMSNGKSSGWTQNKFYKQSEVELEALMELSEDDFLIAQALIDAR